MKDLVKARVAAISAAAIFRCLGAFRSSGAMNLNKRMQDESGLILITVLTLLTALTLAGVTTFIVASTEVKVAGNFVTNQKVLQVAMAGAEQGRQTLRAANTSSTNTSNFSEELAAQIPSLSAAIILFLKLFTIRQQSFLVQRTMCIERLSNKRGHALEH